MLLVYWVGFLFFVTIAHSTLLNSDNVTVCQGECKVIPTTFRNEIQWMLEEIKLKPETNGDFNIGEYCVCFKVVQGFGWKGGLMLIATAGVVIGIPLGYFIPVIPYFAVAKWISAVCTFIQQPSQSMTCGKSGCQYLGQVEVSYNTTEGKPVIATLYSSDGQIANLQWSQVQSWLLSHQPYNSTTCYYNPDNNSDLTDSQIVPWYLYLYAVVMAPVLIGGTCCCIGGTWAIFNFLKGKSGSFLSEHRASLTFSTGSSVTTAIPVMESTVGMEVSEQPYVQSGSTVELDVSTDRQRDVQQSSNSNRLFPPTPSESN